MQIAKWGNSLGLRLPASLVRQLGLKPGVECEFLLGGDHGFAVKVQRDAHKRLGALRRLRGRMPTGFRFDREQAHERSA